DAGRTRFDQLARWVRSACLKDDWCRQIREGSATEDALKSAADEETAKKSGFLYRNDKAAGWAKGYLIGPLADGLSADYTRLLFVGRCHSGFLRDLSESDGRLCR